MQDYRLIIVMMTVEIIFLYSGKAAPFIGNISALKMLLLQCEQHHFF
jgi:hypothetical protein